MLNIILKKINIDKSLYKKIEYACKFNQNSFKLFEGKLHIVEKTNLAYVEPHKVIIKDNVLLFFNEQNIFYLNTLNNPKQISELDKIIKTI